jgi:ribonucleotide monophosphatase NagD (HAD superfamily)
LNYRSTDYQSVLHYLEKKMNSPPLLIDFDGVIKIGDKPAPDATEFFKFIKKKKVSAFVISNSTLKTSDDIKNFLNHSNIHFNIPAMTASEACIKICD